MDSGIGGEDEMPLLPRSSPTTRGRSWPNACLLFLVFVQTFGYYKCDEVLKDDHIKFFQNTEIPGHRPWPLIFAVMVYILPLALAIFSDTVAGRRCAIGIGMGLKTSGSLIGFIVILLFESVENLDQMSVKTLIGAYGFGALLFIVGMVLLFPALLAFTADQVEQTPRNVSSNMRWVCWTVVLALAICDGYFALQPPSLEAHRYYQTIRHAVVFGCDVISIALFVSGRSHFNISTAVRGRESWHEIISIVKRHILCMTRKMSPVEEHMTNAEWERSTRRERIFQRLKLKKGVFFFMILSSMSFAWSVVYVIDQLFHVSYYWRHNWLIPVLKHSKHLIILLVVPIMELTIRRIGRPLWQDTTANLLKTIGVGSSLTALALVFVGGLDMYPWDAGEEITGFMFMVLPPFIVSGLATLMMLPPGFAHWYLESAPGLQTFTLTLGVSLGFFPLVLGAALNAVVHQDEQLKDGTLCYILAAIALGFLVIGYIPSVIWYGRATTAVHEFLAREQEARQEEDQSKMNGDQSGVDEDQCRMDEDQTSRKDRQSQNTRTDPIPLLDTSVFPSMLISEAEASRPAGQD